MGVTGVLTRKELNECLNAPALKERLVVTPLLDRDAALGESSIDVRLGNQFLVLKRESLAALDLGRAPLTDVSRHKFLSRIVRSRREAFVLHPRQLVIGSSLEYIHIPAGLMCYVVGKSTWGRMGLIIATATKVDPGFKGCVTLEIVNEGEVPLFLYPGFPIAQLVIHRTESPTVYRGRYRCPIGPEFPKFDTGLSLKPWIPLDRSSE
jgi:dCTP deaminase